MAFDEYFTTVADYNRAQFELFHALGYPAREVALLRPPGEVLPVDTARPAYLPRWATGRPRRPAEERGEDVEARSAARHASCTSGRAGFGA